MPPQKDTTRLEFVRDERLPFFEARSVGDGRKTCYAKHAHETFSIGAITRGCSTYLNGSFQARVDPGAVVIINPEAVHACNPLADQHWAYTMFFVDAAWLGQLVQETGDSPGASFKPFATRLSHDKNLYRGLNELYDIVKNETASLLHKESALHEYFASLHDRLQPEPCSQTKVECKLIRAADYINDNATQNLRLADICTAAELSSSYLIRAFKKQYGLTPHAYQTNRRIQYCRTRLKKGHFLAEIALDAGFSDQAHFQREFKRLVAATPGQYRGQALFHTLQVDEKKGTAQQ